LPIFTFPMLRIGDILHILGIIIVCAQFFVMLTDINGSTHIFSEFYNKQGFCRSTEESHGFDSFQICAIIDTCYCIFAAVFLWTFPYTDRLKPDSNEIWKGIPGVFFHGMAHFGQYYVQSNDDASLPRIYLDLTLVQHSKRFFPLLLMWFFLIKSVLSTNRSAAMGTPFIIFVHYCFIPQRLAFAYVNAVLVILFSIANLIRNEKDFWYDLYAMVVSFPITLVGWMEGYFCLDFVLGFGGHALYDGWICFGNMIFMLVAFALTDNPQGKEKTA